MYWVLPTFTPFMVQLLFVNMRRTGNNVHARVRTGGTHGSATVGSYVTVVVPSLIVMISGTI